MPSSGGYSSGRSLSSGLSSRSRSLTPLAVGGGGFGGGRGRPVTSIGGGRSIMTASGSRSAVLPSGSRSVVRPMTGLARIDAENRAGSTPNWVVESAGFYQSLLQSKIEAILAETERLRSEAAMADCESEPRRALDKKHREMAASVADLEGQLADYNLAREHARSGAGIEEIQRAASALVRGNKLMEKEVDKVFFARKKVEEEEQRAHAELEAIHGTVEAKLLGGEDGDEEVHEYRALVKDVEAVVVETKRQEDDTVLLKHKLKTLGGSEYAPEKRRVEELKRQLDGAEDDVQLAQMTAGDAEAFLLAKAGDMRDQTKELEGESSQTKREISVLHEIGRELRTELRTISSGGHKRQMRKEQKAKRFLDNVPEKKAALADERTRLEVSIESLRNDIRQADEMAATGVPSVEEMQLMREEAAFAGKQLDANQETMALLERQKEARAGELDSINNLEGRIRDEMEELSKQSAILRKEMEKYQNLDGLREESDATRERLMEAKDSLRWGIQLLEDLIDEAPSHDELERSPKWRELVEVKSKLRSQEGSLENDASEPATEYAKAKYECLRLVEEINQALILSQ